MASLSSWTEVALFMILFMTCIGIVVVSLNSDYGRSENPTFGIVTNSTLNEINQYQSTIEQGMEGEAETSSLTGVSLGTAWGMIKAGMSIAFNFVTGSWIENAVNLLNWGAAGTALALTLRLLFVLSIGFILLKLILKVRP